MNEDSMKELERLRKQISQQEKMASLGLLSAGIAHEIPVSYTHLDVYKRQPSNI